ncbi:ATP-binding protein [uncultured Lacinutrix sp.]|uniref:ATP-binding protein n=1 Tax=uncultured Lacinutrix sp. TaxID=574032 RepID=UPI00260CF17B|nr:ATP-binding protein [uncultured Lacinutrix sp.]
MNTKTIVITGGPGSGKTSIINELTKRGFTCFEEISRQIILKSREDGIEQLFLTNPIQFSELLLEGRVKQHSDALESDNEFVFLDRGIPDIPAYMDFKGDTYPDFFTEACDDHKYDSIFILAPWQEIFTTDSERYENFDQALEIHEKLLDTYTKSGYDLRDVPFGSIEARADYIIDVVKAL